MTLRHVLSFALLMALIEGVAGAFYARMYAQGDFSFTKGLIFGIAGLATFLVGIRYFIRETREINITRAALFAAAFVPLYWFSTAGIYEIWPGRKPVPVFLCIAFFCALAFGEILRRLFNSGIGDRPTVRKRLVHVAFGVVVVAAVYETAFSYLQVEVFTTPRVGPQQEWWTWTVAGLIATLIAAPVPYLWEKLRGPQEWFRISK